MTARKKIFDRKMIWAGGATSPAGREREKNSLDPQAARLHASLRTWMAPCWLLCQSTYTQARVHAFVVQDEKNDHGHTACEPGHIVRRRGEGSTARACALLPFRHGMERGDYISTISYLGYRVAHSAVSASDFL
jgi:hypothetical protein